MAIKNTTHPSGLEAPKITQDMKSTKTQDAAEPPLNGHSNPSTNAKSLSEDEFAVLSLRNLLFDICNQYGGGHGGSAIGMAAIGVALFKYIMRYNPSNPSWFDRDRFVLSNGKTFTRLISRQWQELTLRRSRGHVPVRPQPLGRI